MKKLLALAAVLAVFASVSQAQSLSLDKLKLYGQGEMLARNNGRTGLVKTNAMLGASLDIAKNIKANLALGYTSMWGDAGLIGRNISSDNNSNSGYLNNIRVLEANLTLGQLFDVDGLNAKVGRQFYGDQNSTVMYFGIRNYTHMPGAEMTSLDALTFNYCKDNVKANVIYGQIANKPAPTKSPFLVGGDVKVSKIADLIDVEAYLYDAKNNAVSVSPASSDYTIIGVKPAVKYKGLTASVEFAKNFAGDKMFASDVKAFDSNLIKVDVAYKIEDINLTPRATYFAAGGEAGRSFTTFGDYYPGVHGFTARILQNGANNTITYVNAQLVNVGVDYAWNKLALSLDYFHYTLREKEYGKDEGANGEIALWANYAFTDTIGLYAGIGEYIAKDVDFGSDGTLMIGITYKI